MVRPGEVYSQVIAWLKVLLPLAALALLSTLFLLSQSREPLENVPFATALQAGERAAQGVAAPHYSGTLQGGELLTMTAVHARPLQGDDILATDLSARVQTNDGGEIRFDAVQATIHDADREALLEGGVRFESSSGYVLTTKRLLSALDKVAAESLGPVQGEGPLGTLEAGRMRIAPLGESGDVQILFTDGVKLIYRPPEKEGAE